MSNSGLSQAAHIWGRIPPTNKSYVVSARRRVSTNLVSGRMLHQSTEPVIAILCVPSDFLVEGHVSGLGTVHPLLTLNVFRILCDLVT